MKSLKIALPKHHEVLQRSEVSSDRMYHSHFYPTHCSVKINQETYDLSIGDMQS